MDQTDEPQKPTRLFSLRSVLLFLLLIAAFAAYYAGFLRLNASPGFDSGVYDVRLQNLDTTTMLHEKRIEKLEDDLQKLETTGKPAASASSATATPAAPAAAPAEDARVAALEKEVAALKATGSAQGSDQLYQSIRLLSSFHRFSDKVLSGKPFATELAAFTDQMGENETVAKALSELAPYAESGIPTFAQLLTSFDASLEQVNALEAAPPPGSTLWQRFTYNIRHLVRIRKLDEQQAGTGIDAIIGRASAHLDREEIEAAQTEVKSLPDNARSAFSGWLDDAQTNSDAPSLIDQIEEQVMQKAFHTDAAAAQAKEK